MGWLAAHSNLTECMLSQMKVQVVDPTRGMHVKKHVKIHVKKHVKKHVKNVLFSHMFHMFFTTFSHAFHIHISHECEILHSETSVKRM